MDSTFSKVTLAQELGLEIFLVEFQDFSHSVKFFFLKFSLLKKKQLNKKKKKKNSLMDPREFHEIKDNLFSRFLMKSEIILKLKRITVE